MDSIPTPPASAPAVCPVCHQPVRPEFYFCPNCGKSLTEKPLSTSWGTQAWIYALSIAMPWLAFLVLSYWPGIKYMKSDNEYTKQIGIIATVLMAISTIVTFWSLIVWTEAYVQSSVNSIGNLAVWADFRCGGPSASMRSAGERLRDRSSCGRGIAGGFAPGTAPSAH